MGHFISGHWGLPHLKGHLKDQILILTKRVGDGNAAPVSDSHGSLLRLCLRSARTLLFGPYCPPFLSHGTRLGPVDGPSTEDIIIQNKNHTKFSKPVINA